MNLAEIREHRLAEAQGPGSARVIPCGCFGIDLQVVDGRPHGCEHGADVGLGIEHAGCGGLVAPMARARIAMAQTGGDGILTAWRIIPIGRSHLE